MKRVELTYEIREKSIILFSNEFSVLTKYCLDQTLYYIDSYADGRSTKLLYVVVKKHTGEMTPADFYSLGRLIKTLE